MADELFKTHSIASLRGMLSKIQTEISQKKSLLRTCVGTKYRDVIQASDSIAEMKALVVQLQNILQSNVVMDVYSESIKDNEPHLEVAILLQLMMWVPQEIYKTDDCLQAAGLIVIGEWAFERIMEYSEFEFPIAFDQKDLLDVLKIKVLDDAFSSLKDLEGLNEDTLVAILLTSDTSHLLLIQKIFDFSRKELEGQELGGNALEWIEGRTKYILSFLTKVLDLFKLKDGKAGFDQKNDTAMKELENLVVFKEKLLKLFSEKPDVERVVSLLNTEFHFKKRETVPFSHNDLTKLVSDWISFVFSDTKDKVQSLLSHVNSGVDLANIRDGVLLLTARCELERESGELGALWSLYSNKIISKEISFWTDLYQKIFSDRFFSIMLTSFGTVFNNFSLSLDIALSKGIDSSVQNIAASFWRDHSIWSKNPALKKAGQTDEANILILEFEDKIKDVLNDYWPMLTYPSAAPGKENTLITIESLYDLERIAEKDSKEIKVAFENCSKDFTLKCMELISREDINEHNLHKVIFIGRLCKGLADFVSAVTWTLPVSRDRNDKSLIKADSKTLTNNKAYYLFIKTYHSIHEIWLKYLIENFETSLLERFEEEQWDQEDIWTNLWLDHAVEAIEGQEQTESLKVPVYASHNLMKKLFHVSESVQRIGAHDLDRSLLIVLSFSLGKSLCKIYESLLPKSMPDKVTVQLLFDVYFIMKIFEGTWSLDSSEFSEKLEFKRRFQSLLASYKAKIDPIDLAVYDNHLLSYSERFLQKQSVLLSPLMIFANKATESRKQFSDNESHQVLSLALATPRFTLLPIGMPSKTRNSFTENVRKSSVDFFRRTSDIKSRKKPIVTITLDSKTIKTSAETVYSYVGNRQAADLLKNASSYLSGVLSTSRKP